MVSESLRVRLQHWLILCAFCAPSLFPSSAHAGVLMSLQQQGSLDLSNLNVGDSVTIDVVLSGLGSGESLDYLAATADFNASVFGTAFDLSAGSMVDSSGLVLSNPAGFADGNFDTLMAPIVSPISSNGVFFTFSVAAIDSGSGEFTFSFLDAALGLVKIDIAAGPPLSFNVNGANAVPEPSSAMVCCVALLALSTQRRARILKR